MPSRLLAILIATAAFAVHAQTTPAPESTPAGAIAGAAAVGPDTTPAAPESAAVLTPPTAEPAAAPEPQPADVHAYKRTVAEQIVQANRNAVKTDAARPSDAVIKGLSVVGVHVRADGSIERTWIVRSAGDSRLDQIALASVNQAAPLPRPPEETMVGRGFTIFAESWIHRVDGKFQLVSKTVSAATASVLARVKSGSGKSASAQAPAAHVVRATASGLNTTVH